VLPKKASVADWLLKLTFSAGSGAGCHGFGYFAMAGVGSALVAG